MQRQFRLVETEFSGLFVCYRNYHKDDRGTFERVFCSEELSSHGFFDNKIQSNYSFNSLEGTVRGMHYQNLISSEAKLICCMAGVIFDVVVDVRANSPTFMKYFSIVLSAENHESLLIPPGFAHGFQTMSDQSALLYFHSTPYDKQNDAGLNPLDPVLEIDWPLEVTEISDRDSSAPFLKKDFEGLRL